MNTHLRPDCYTSRISRGVPLFPCTLKCGTCVDVNYSCGSVLVCPDVHLLHCPGYFYEIPSIGAIRINTQV